MIKKRALSLLMAFVLLFSLLPADARADDSAAVEGTDYVYDAEAKRLTIKTNAFGPGTFAERGNVTSVVIEKAVDQVVAHTDTPVFLSAFNDYKSLVSFEVEAGNTLYSSIDGALYAKGGKLLVCYPQCRAASLGKNYYILPDGVEFVSKDAFAGYDNTFALYARADTKNAIDSYASTYFTTGLSNLPVSVPEADYADPTGIRLSEAALALAVGDTSTLSTTVLSADASCLIQGVTWESSNTAVATVDSSGSVAAVARGAATITATSVEGGVTATCAVTVADIPIRTLTAGKGSDGAEILAYNVDATEGAEPLTLTVTINADATFREVTWTSSDDTLAVLRAVSGSDEDAARSVAVEAGATDNKSSVVVVPKGSGTVTVTASGGASGAEVSKAFMLTLDKWVTGVALDELPLYLEPGMKKTLHAALSPDDATGAAVTWSSGASDIASINGSTGEVTAAAPGDATITVSVTTGDRTRTQTGVVHVRSIELNKDTLSLIQGSGETLAAIVKPEGAADISVTWTSSNESIAAVDSNGKVTAKAVGAATITATTAPGGFTATCEVSVSKIPVEGVTLDRDTLKLALFGGDSGQVFGQLGAEVSNENATFKTVTWKSSDEGVATVDANGKVAAVSVGTANITATADGVESAACAVTVSAGALELSYTELSMKRGGDSPPSRVLTATLSADDAFTPRTVTWKSDATGVVTVDHNTTAVDPLTGQAAVTLTGVKAGSANVTATVGTTTVVCRVTVSQAAASLSIAPHEYTLTLNGTEAEASVALVPTIAPGDVTDTVAWTSNNESVATVDANGKVTAQAAGSAVITAGCSGLTDSCTITVNTRPASVSLDASALSIEKDRTAALTVTVLPGDAVGNTVEWTSSDETVATVTDNGDGTATVKAVAASGTATITAKTSNGRSASCAVTAAPVKVTSVTLTPSSAELVIDADRTLAAAVLPEDAADQTVTWTSSDESVATVDANGKVIAVKMGTATITAAANDGSGVKGTCAVTVPELPVDTVSLPETLDLLIDPKHPDSVSQTLTASIAPAKASFKNLTWSVTSGDGVISYAVAPNDSAKVTVRALKSGTAVLTASSSHGAGGSVVNDSCTVNVTTAATEVSLDHTTLDLSLTGGAEDKLGTLTATVKPAGVTDAVTWESSDEEIVAVGAAAEAAIAGGKTSTVRITVRKGGKATVTVRSGGYSDQCVVTIPIPVTGVTLDSTEISVEKNRTATLTAAVKPDDAAVKTVIWASSDEDVVTVADNGDGTATVTAKKDSGAAIITATAADGSGVKGSCTVNAVPVAVTGVRVTPSDTEIARGGTAELTAVIVPEDAAVKTVAWSSSNTDIAAVDADGVVTAKAVGSAVITATATDGGFTASCTVTVPSVEATNIYLSQTSMTLYRGGTGDTRPASGTLSVRTILPSNTTDSIAWRSNNESVATVSVNEAGTATVTAVGVGSANIIAAARSAATGDVSSRVTAVCAVTVNALVGSLTLTPSEASMYADGEVTLTAAVDPADATTPELQWESSNANVYVNNGVVTAKQDITEAITATITVKTTDGSNLSKTCEITVNPIRVASLTISHTSLETAATGTRTLTATVEPSNAAKKTLAWTSSSEDVATVVNGVVTPLKPGTTTITVKTTDGTNLSKTCVVTVTETKAETITLNTGSLTIDMAAGETEKTLTATVTPDYTTDKGAIWSSGSNSVASVDSDGKVTAHQPGTAVITASAKSNGSVKASCTVTVTAKNVTGVSLAKASITLEAGADEQLSYTVEPGDAFNDAVEWRSGNNSVATVDSDGTVHAVAAGTTTVTVITKDGGKTAACVVTVRQPVERVELNKETAGLTVGESETLLATVQPGNASNKNVSWTSDAPGVATVDQAGKVTAVGAGEAVITAATEDGNQTASCTVTVSVVAVEAVDVTPAAATLKVNEQRNLTAAVTPGNATDASVTWTSSDEAVAKVSLSGLVTAIGAGEAVITAVARDGSGESASCTVTVRSSVDSVSLSPASVELTLAAGTTPVTTALSATVNPSDTGAPVDESVTWRSLNESVAKVDNNGLVTAVAPGTAIITVTANDGGKSASCAVTVLRHAASADLSPSAINLSLTDSDKRSATLTATISPGDMTDTVTWNVTGDTGAVTLGAAAATVTDAGKQIEIPVYAKAAGTAKISVTASSPSGSLTSSVCTVTVAAPSTDITLDKYALTLHKDDEETLTPTVFPADAEDKSVAWQNSNPGAVTVTEGENGSVTVTAVAVGSAVITASDANGHTAQCAVTVEPIPVSGVSISGDGTPIKVSETLRLTATVSPSDASVPGVNWTSGNERVATVDNGGLVTAVAVGTAVITAAAKDGSGAYNTFLVTVEATPVESVSLNSESLSFDLADGTPSAQLLATVLPVGATDKAVSWVSSDRSVATVDDTGLVTAVGVGSAAITARSRSNSAAYQECAVTVTASVTGVTLDEAALTLPVGAEKTLTAAVRPDAASGAAVTWASSNPAVASVDAISGRIVALAAGTTDITATAGGKTSAACAVTVPTPVESVSIRVDGEDAPLTAGETLRLIADVSPSAAANKAVAWSSGDEAVATVDSSGTVLAVGVGSTTILVTTADGSKTASYLVRVVQKATSITVSPSALSLAKGRSGELSAVLSADATETGVTWRSSAADIASVDENSGVVTAKAAGTAVITATTKDGSGLSAACDVTVYESVTGVTIRKSGTSADITSLTLKLPDDGAADLAVSLAPEGAAGTTVTWTSSSTSVVEVSGNGHVVAKSGMVNNGVATITATVTDAGGGTRSAICDVSVQRSTVSVDGGTDSLLLKPGALSGTVTFTSDAELTLTGGNSDVVRVADNVSGGQRTYTFAAQQNGVVTYRWSKAADDSYTASSGSITVYSFVEPITSVSVNAGTGNVLAASVDTDGRVIRLSGYEKDVASPGSFDLTGKLSFVLADGSLTAAYDNSGVTVKQSGTEICSYTIDRTNVVYLPANVNASVALIAPANTEISSVRNSATTVTDLDAAVSEAKTLANDKIEEAQAAAEESGTAIDIQVAITVEPTAETVRDAGSYQLVEFNIEPKYTVTADGETIAEGTLTNLSHEVTLSVKVNFRPTLIVHMHNGSPEYPGFSCSAMDGDGYYTVTWTQSSFSGVSLLNEEAEKEYRANLSAASTTPSSRPSGGGSSGGGAIAKPVEPEQPAKPETPVLEAKAFTDVAAEHWAAEAIGYASARGILNGVSTAKFGPELAMSRAMAAQMLYNFDDDKSAGASPFADTSGVWYEQAAAWAALHGVATGSYNKFRGDDIVTREQLATMLYRYAALKGYDISADTAPVSLTGVSDWAADAMRWAVGTGLIRGTDRGLEPQGGATRAQVAMIMMRFCETVAK